MISPPPPTPRRISFFLFWERWGSIDPCTVFSTFDWHQLAKIHKNNVSILLKMPSLNVTCSQLTQRHRILQIFVWWGTGSCPPPHTNITVEQYLLSLLTNHLQNWFQEFPNFEQCQGIFVNWSLSKLEKICGKVCYM